MEIRMTRWGVGPRITLVSAVYAILAAAATFAWPDVCLMRFPPAAVWYTLGGVLLATGIPVLGVAFTTVMKAYNRGQLVTTGIFGLVRNPVYAAWILFLGPGFMLLTRSWPLLLTPVAAYLAFKAFIHREDDYLLRNFGVEYAAYRARVNELIPLPRLQRKARRATAAGPGHA